MREHIKIHPAANLFPMMSDSDFKKLKDDIDVNGQLVPITYWGEQLLDGRHRLRACQELSLEPIEEELDEELTPDPYQWVISQNLHRRHLTDQQRAIIASKLANMKSGARTDLVSSATRSSTSVSEAASMLQVSKASVARAKSVIKNGSADVVAAVERNEIPLATAEKLTKEVKDKREQSKIVKQGKQAVAERLKQAEKPTPKKADNKPVSIDDYDGKTAPDGSDLLAPIPLPDPNRPYRARKRLPELVSAYRRSATKIEDLHVLVEDLEQDVRAIILNWIS